MKIKIGEMADGSYLIKINGVMRTICPPSELYAEAKKVLDEFLHDPKSCELDFETDGFSSDKLDVMAEKYKKRKMAICK